MNLNILGNININKRVFALTASAAFIGIVVVSYKIYSTPFDYVIFSQAAQTVISTPKFNGEDPNDANFTTCSFPRLNPFEPSVVKLANLDQKTLTCDSGLPDLTYVEGSRLIVNKTKVSEKYPFYKDVTCKYRDVLRQNDRDSSFKYGEFRKPFTDFTPLPPETEFILVVCEGMPPGVSGSGAPNFNISATPDANVSGTHEANVSGTPSVNVTGTPNLNIKGTPTTSVNVSRKPNFNKSATHDANVSGTPSVYVSDTPIMNVSGTHEANVSGTPNVNITGTPTTKASETPAVNVSGMPRSSVKVNAPSTLSRTYFALTPALDGLKDTEAARLLKRAAETSPRETMNVIVVGFDAVSRYQFMRAMSRTYSLLVNGLHSYDMVMYNQVGKNTFPNFLPLLTGRADTEIYRWWDGKQPSDEFDLIWRDFERVGYRTLFSEDWPQIGAFNYLAPGFRKVPTTYYSKALIYAVENDAEARRGGSLCVGNRPEVLFHLDYLQRYFDTLGAGKPLFALVYLTRSSHDDVTRLRTIDDHVHRFYARMNETGILNNTMLVTFSDHGMRYGALRSTSLGEVEHRNPYAIFTLPPWFAKKYPDVARNLKTNTNRLTTHFDTHATFQDLLYFLGNGDTPLRQPKHGVSLFREIPRNRTCEDAAIPPYFCICDHHYRLSVDANSEISQFLAGYVVRSMNERIDTKLCHSLKIRKVLEITRVQTVDKNSGKETTLFKVKVETAPGEGVFEAVVHAADVSGGKAWDQLTTAHLQNVTAGDVVDRLNMYRGQSDCVDDVKMKLFCYCNDLLKS